MENIEGRVTEIEDTVRRAAISGVQEAEERERMWQVEYLKTMTENFL